MAQTLHSVEELSLVLPVFDEMRKFKKFFTYFSEAISERQFFFLAYSAMGISSELIRFESLWYVKC